MESEKLKLLRVEIDTIDQQIAKLFQKRMDVVKRVALEKMTTGLEIYDPEREDLVLEKHLPLIKKEYSTIYQVFLKQLLMLSKEVQSKVWVEKGNRD